MTKGQWKDRAKTMRERYGEDYFKQLGARGGKKTFETYGSEHQKEVGNLGGQATLHRYGEQHYKKMRKSRKTDDEE